RVSHRVLRSTSATLLDIKMARRDLAGHDIKYLKNQEKVPNPTPPDPGGHLREGLVTHTGEIRQLGWISHRLAGICSR
ncbi:hypothetical protein, partial [Streptomyces cyaneofuscatus]|uniref:hypothetical protein n=1 Tax=Streptomyces cyaneofuscatus TaxID=66883 RepID=UPI00341C1C3A